MSDRKTVLFKSDPVMKAWDEVGKSIHREVGEEEINKSLRHIVAFEKKFNCSLSNGLVYFPTPEDLTAFLLEYA